MSSEALAVRGVADVTARVRRVQEIMKDLMHDGTHFGTIPGTPKPTLYQAGAELLCVTFRVAPEPQVEDLSTPDAIRYRVTMRGANQATGEMLGAGVGECSSDEEKYRWRKPVCDEEWEETPADQRREKWQRGKNGNYKAKQVRMHPADIGNTVLKMASKRALIAMTRTVLACSDIFAQDLEDLSAEVRESVAEEDHRPIQPPQSKAKPSNGGMVITDGQRRRFYAISKEHGWSDDEAKALLKNYGVEHSNEIKTADYESICAALEAGPKAGE